MEQNAPFVPPCSVITNIPKSSACISERRKSKREGSEEVSIIVVFAVGGKGVEPKCGVLSSSMRYIHSLQILYCVHFSQNNTLYLFSQVMVDML